VVVTDVSPGLRAARPPSVHAEAVLTHLTIYCGRRHRTSDGVPVEHPCRLLDLEYLRAEHAEDYERAAEILERMPIILHGGLASVDVAASQRCLFAGHRRELGFPQFAPCFAASREALSSSKVDGSRKSSPPRAGGEADDVRVLARGGVDLFRQVVDVVVRFIAGHGQRRTKQSTAPARPRQPSIARVSAWPARCTPSRSGVHGRSRRRAHGSDFRPKLVPGCAGARLRRRRGAARGDIAAPGARSSWASASAISRASVRRRGSAHAPGPQHRRRGGGTRVGWRIDPRWMIGAYVELQGAGNEPRSDHATGLAAGLPGQFHFLFEEVRPVGGGWALAGARCGRTAASGRSHSRASIWHACRSARITA
jgi:hypothetical protein